MFPGVLFYYRSSFLYARLIFASSDKVDAIWSKIAGETLQYNTLVANLLQIVSLASGPLSSTSALCAKVATSPENVVPGAQHVICVYVPDVYDKEDVTVVCLGLKCMLEY